MEKNIRAPGKFYVASKPFFLSLRYFTLKKVGKIS